MQHIAGASGGQGYLKVTQHLGSHEDAIMRKILQPCSAQICWVFPKG